MKDLACGHYQVILVSPKILNNDSCFEYLWGTKKFVNNLKSSAWWGPHHQGMGWHISFRLPQNWASPLSSSVKTPSWNTSRNGHAATLPHQWNDKRHTPMKRPHVHISAIDRPSQYFPLRSQDATSHQLISWPRLYYPAIHTEWRDSTQISCLFQLSHRTRRNRAELNTNWKERHVEIYTWTKQAQTAATFSSHSSKIKKFKVWE